MYKTVEKMYKIPRKMYKTIENSYKTQKKMYKTQIYKNPLGIILKKGQLEGK
jgi:hypothetical protein